MSQDSSKKTIHIGIESKSEGSFLVDPILQLLNAEGYTPEVIYEKDGLKLLNKGLMDIYVVALDQLPVPFSEGPYANLVIAALGKRNNGKVGLLHTGKATIDENNPNIHSISPIMGLQYNELMGKEYDFEYPEVTNLSWTEASKPLLIPVQHLDATIDAKNLFQFNEEEMTPFPGQGVTAFICSRDNLSIRKTLASLNDVDTMNCTNLERKIQLKLQNEGHTKVVIHCRKDQAGNYHVNAGFLSSEGIFKKVKLSQSTFIGMEERVVQKLLE